MAGAAANLYRPHIRGEAIPERLLALNQERAAGQGELAVAAAAEDEESE
jgi:hypothetical protein